MTASIGKMRHITEDHQGMAKPPKWCAECQRERVRKFSNPYTRKHFHMTEENYEAMKKRLEKLENNSDIIK